MKKEIIESQIELLKKQLAMINHKKFDAEAWKSSTIILLESIFGSHTQKIKQLENVNTDYSSWSLRDSQGGLHPIKIRGREILKLSIAELELKVLDPVNEQKKQAENSHNEAIQVIISAIESKLTVSQYKIISAIAQEKISITEKQKKLRDNINAFGSELAMQILTGILSDNQISQNL